MLFEGFSDDCKVWVYAANRQLTGTEISFAEERMHEFIDQWTAHGAALKADFALLEGCFIVLVADEKDVKASGCSIDSSVRFIKELGRELGVDFFNRLLMMIEKDGEKKRVLYGDLSDYPDWNYFNTMVRTLGEMRKSWKQSVSQILTGA